MNCLDRTIVRSQTETTCDRCGNT